MNSKLWLLLWYNFYLSLCLSHLWERKRKKEIERKHPIENGFQVLRLKQKYSILDLTGRVLCYLGRWCPALHALHTWRNTCMQLSFLVYIRYNKNGPVSWEREQSVPFPVAFLFLAGHKHPYFTLSCCRHRRNEKEMTASMCTASRHPACVPFAREGEAGLESPLFWGWNHQNEVFPLTAMSRTLSLVKSHFFLGDSTLEKIPKSI